MSVDKTIFTYYGVLTEFNDEVNEHIHMLDDQNIATYGWGNTPPDAECDILADGMCGEYMLFGKRLFSSRSDDRTQFLPDQETLDAIRREYMEQFKRLYPAHYDWLSAKTWHIVTLAHYT